VGGPHSNRKVAAGETRAERGGEDLLGGPFSLLRTPAPILLKEDERG